MNDTVPILPGRDWQMRVLKEKIQLFLQMPPLSFCRKVMCIVPPLKADSSLRFQESGPNLIFLLEGNQRTVFTDKYGRQEYSHQPGEVLYLEHGIHYTTFWDKACLRLGIAMTPTGFFVSWNENPGQGMYVKTPDIYLGEDTVECADFRDLFAALGARVRQYELTDEVSCTLPRLVLHVVLEMLEGGERRQKNGDPLFKRISGYIEHNYMRHMTGKALAEQFGISEGHLSRSFKRCCGTGIGGYICSVRMEHAYRMLYDHRYSVEKTAKSCGFNDPSYFVKVFCRYWKVRPGDLRRHQDSECSSTPVLDFYRSSTADK